MNSNEYTSEQISVQKLHKRYIRGREKEAFVAESSILLCNLTFAVQEGANFASRKVYLKTRVLKHLYDKRPAQEYDSIVANLTVIAKYPDKVYENKGGKRGSKCLVKAINQVKYFVVLEEDEISVSNFIVSAFKVDDDYLEGFKEIWSWEGGDLHRNTLDATKK